MKIRINNISIIFFLALLFLIICYPLQFQLEKVIMIIITLVLAIISGKRPRISKLIMIVLILTITYNFINLTYTSFYGYSPFVYFSLYLASPILYVALFSLYYDFLRTKLFYIFLTVFSCFISILDINSVALSSKFGGSDIVNNLFTGRVGIHDGYTQIVDYNVYSLFFLTPFLIALLTKRAIPLVFLFPSVILTITAVILTGRRALWLAIAISFLVLCIIIVVKILIKDVSRQNIFKIFLSISGVFILSVILVSIDSPTILATFGGLAARFSDAFSDTGGLGIRDLQQKVLLQEWSTSPVFGNGIAVPASLIRSIEFVTAYESSYHALLYQIGLLGFLLYSVPTLATLLGLLFSFFKLSDDTLQIACGVGLLSILIGISSNPYFGSFDGLWMLFLPIMVYNDLLLKKESKRENSKNFNLNRLIWSRK